MQHSIVVRLKEKFFAYKKLTEVDEHDFDEQQQPTQSPQIPSCISTVRTRLTATITVLFLLYLWFSSSTLISSSDIHVCLTSWSKINSSKPYCLSSRVGRRPFLDAPLLDNTTTPANSSVMEPISVKEGDEQGKTASSSIPTAAITATEDDSVTKVVEDKVEAIRSYKMMIKINYSDPDACKGKGIYVYDLPPKFNTDLVTNCSTADWIHFCEFLSNNAFGDPVPDFGSRWFNTHQFSLEPTFHSRVLNHPCRAYKPEEAKLFYVPFYAGIDLMRWQFNEHISQDTKDELSLELIKWLNKQKWWKLHSGFDHVFVLGKTTWDFRMYGGFTYGNRFLNMKEMQNPTTLLIERNVWQINDVGVPYPSFFHPSSDEDIASWQHQLIQTPRKHLVSFAGAPRPGDPDSIRSILINQCNSSTSCNFFHCKSHGLCHNPSNIIRLFMESEFCLQPTGDSPTRKSFFDSLVSGCIPVVFSPYTAYYQYPWYLPQERSKFSVFLNQDEVRSGKINVIERLERISENERFAMRRYIVNDILPGLVYADPNGRLERFDDAVTVAMNALFEKMTKLP